MADHKWFVVNIFAITVPIYAQGLVRLGKPYEEIADRLRRDQRRVHVISLCDTLDYAYKGGRLSLAAKVTGNVLKIKPIITTDEKGKVKVIGKARGEKNAYRLFTSLVEETGGIDFRLPVCMAYSGLTDANMRIYMDQESALFGEQLSRVHLSQIGATVGTYSGPGAFAIGFFHQIPAKN